MRSHSRAPFTERLAFCLALVLLTVACVDERPQSPHGSREVNAEEVNRLRALGYVDVGNALGKEEAVGLLLSEDGAAPGLTLVTDAHRCKAELLDMEGLVVREWSHAPCHRWGNSVILPNGDLLVVGRAPHDHSPQAARAARYVMRLSWDGDVRWRTALAAHHDVELTPDGRIATLTYSLRTIAAVDPTIPTRDHAISLLSADGKLIEEIPLWSLLKSSPEIFEMQEVSSRDHDGADEFDVFHSNAIEWMRRPDLADRHPIYSLDNVMVCIRHQDTVAIVDWEHKKLVWAWGQGVLSGPHDATLLENGNVLVFDNGLGREWSRVVEVNPLTREIVWEYRAPEPTTFYTATRGANQRLSNGNTLITDSAGAIVFEVTGEGGEVWRYRNRNLNSERQPSVLVRARRFEGLTAETMAGRVRSGTVPWVD